MAAVFVQPGGADVCSRSPRVAAEPEGLLYLSGVMSAGPLIVELRAGTLGVLRHLIARGFTGDPLASFTFNGAAA